MLVFNNENNSDSVQTWIHLLVVLGGNASYWVNYLMKIKVCVPKQALSWSWDGFPYRLGLFQ